MDFTPREMESELPTTQQLLDQATTERNQLTNQLKSLQAERNRQVSELQDQIVELQDKMIDLQLELASAKKGSPEIELTSVIESVPVVPQIETDPPPQKREFSGEKPVLGGGTPLKAGLIPKAPPARAVPLQQPSSNEPPALPEQTAE